LDRNNALVAFAFACTPLLFPETAEASFNEQSSMQTDSVESQSAEDIGPKTEGTPKIEEIAPAELNQMRVYGELIVLETSANLEFLHYELSGQRQAISGGQICIPAGEYLVFQDSNGVHEVAGVTCLIPEDPGIEQDPSERKNSAAGSDAPGSASPGSDNQIDPSARAAESVVVARSSGPQSDTFKVGTRLPGNSVIELEEGDTITIVGKYGSRELRGPGSFRARLIPSREQALARVRSQGLITRRPRAGATRGRAAAVSRGLGEVIVWQGTESALSRYPRKKAIPAAEKICLREEETLTLLHKIGGQVVLKGPGCNQFLETGEKVNSAGVISG
jgi:hypothetical protein